MKKFKQFTLGFIMAALIFSALPVKAAIEEYVLYKADYKVIVEGKEYKDPELPVLNYKGNTYVPLNAISNLLNTDVKLNAKLGQVEISKRTNQSPEGQKSSEQIFNDAIKSLKPSNPFPDRKAYTYNGIEYDALIKDNKVYICWKHWVNNKLEGERLGVKYSIDEKAQTITFSNDKKTTTVKLTNADDVVYKYAHYFISLDLMQPFMTQQTNRHFTRNTDAEKIETYKKDGFTIYKYNNIEYVSVGDLDKKFHYRQNKHRYKFRYNLENRKIFIQHYNNSKHQHEIEDLELSNAAIKSLPIHGGYIEYNYFKKNVLPLIEE